MTCFLASPSHQQPWFIFTTRKDFNNLHHFSVRNISKSNFIFPKNKFGMMRAEPEMNWITHHTMAFRATREVNSLAPGRFQFNTRKVIFKLTLVNGGWGISYEFALRWMPQDLTDDKSTSVQVTAWCHQATSHYLSQCWPRSMSPNGVTRPQWVNSLWPSDVIFVGSGNGLLPDGTKPLPEPILTSQ